MRHNLKPGPEPIPKTPLPNSSAIRSLLSKGIHEEVLREVLETWSIVESKGKTFFDPRKTFLKQSDRAFAFPAKEKTSRGYVFETPMELLAVATISYLDYGRKLSGNHMVCTGQDSSVLDQYLRDYPIDCAGRPQLIFYLRNDENWIAKSTAFREKYEALGYMVVSMSPHTRTTYVEELQDILAEKQ